MPIERNRWLLRIIIFFQAFIPAYVIERLFWQSRGIDIRGVVACEMLYALVLIMLEVPSGVLADWLGRKTMLLIGAVTSLLEFIILLYAQQFWHFALAVVLTGIGGACVSGAWNAMLYDTLAITRRADRFEQVLGQIEAIDAVSVVAASLLGGFLAQRLGYAINYQLSIFSTAAALLLTLFLVEPPRTAAKSSGLRAPRQVLSATRKFFQRQPAFLFLLLHASCSVALIIYIDEFWQLYLDAVGFPVSLFGVVILAFSLSKMVGALLAGRLHRILPAGKLLSLLSLVIALGLLAAGSARGLWGLGAMLVCCCSSDIIRIVASGRLHQHADSSARATIESIGSLMERVCSFVFGIVFVYASERISLFRGFTALSVICFALTVFLALYYQKRSFLWTNVLPSSSKESSSAQKER